jgi:hypothetical protein
MTGGYHGALDTRYCSDTARIVGALRISLVSLDRTLYQVGDEPRFELLLRTRALHRLEFPILHMQPISNPEIQHNNSPTMSSR